MKKTFVLIVASLALTACGGTVEAEEQNELRSTENALDGDGGLGLSCDSACTCWLPSKGGNCGWECVSTWNNVTQTYVYSTKTIACPKDSIVCTTGSVSKTCSSPCVVGSFTSSPCS